MMTEWKDEITKRLSGLNLNPVREAEIAEELAQHMEDRYQELLATGIPEEEARRSALEESNDTDLLAQELRRVEHAVAQEPVVFGAGSRKNFLANLWQDLRYGLRQLRRSPGFTAVAVITLALGIGANTAIFSLLNAVLLRPLPYRDPGRLVWISQYAPRLDSTIVPASTFLAWRERSRSFEDVGAYLNHLCDGNLTTGAEPIRLDRCAEVSANLLSTLGVQPVLGRGFLPREDYPGAEGVMILSNGFWRRRFGANPKILGKAIRLDDAEYTIIGILPASFEYPSQFKPDAFVPLTLPRKPDWRPRESDAMSVIARLKPGVTPDRARSELQTIAQSLAQEYPQEIGEKLAGAEVRVTSLHARLVGDTRPALWVLMGAVSLVLLIACVNVANLLLARAGPRQREIAVRAALGAGHGRLIRQFLAEGMLLAALGSAAGWFAAAGTLELVRFLRPATLAYFRDIRLNGLSLCFTLALCLVTAILFSLGPAVLVAGAALRDPLHEAGGKATVGITTRHLGNVLVTAELALALALLSGAGLLIRSLSSLRAVHPGFDPHNVLTAQVTLTESKYPELVQRRVFFEKLLSGVQALPGVRSAGGTTVLPFYYGLSSPVKVTIEDRPHGFTTHSPSAPVVRVTPAYFSAMRTPLEAGRFFTAEDRPGTLPVAIVSREFARRFLAPGDRIGRHLRFAATRYTLEQKFTVVGVVGDVRYIGLDRDPAAVVYTPVAQFPTSALTLVLRSRVSPESLTNAIRAEVQKSNQEQPIYHVATMEQRLADSVGPQRFDAWLLELFASVAVSLAGIGIYGVMFYAVSERTHEIGIRVALGAQRKEVLKLMVGQALKLTLTGVGIGIIGALALTRFLTSLLYSVRPNDPLTFTAVSLILIAVALLASYTPARRATKVDPMVALRHE